MAPTRLFLGLDVGTSMTKAGLFDDGGTEHAHLARPTAASRPRPGWSEADPDSVWDAVAALCRDMVGLARDSGGTIDAVGVAGAMVGAWVVDRDGRALRPGILWDDARTQAAIEASEHHRPGFLSTIFASSGCVLQQGCTLPLLRWLLDHEPEVMRKAAAVIGVKDFVRLRLTGTILTDETEAAVAPGSARTRGRSRDMLALFEVEAAEALLPPPRPSASVAGAVTARAAAQTGLTQGTPVAVGAGDVPASVIGAAALEPGLRVTVLGTTCLNGLVIDAPSFTPPDLGLLFTMPGGLWLRTMVTVSGTAALDWCIAALCPDLAGEGVFARLESLAAGAPPGADGLTFLPYLSPAGIIAPQVEARARGGFSGLTATHGRAALVRAVYEGVIFAVASCYDALGSASGPIRLVGGGGRSRFWCQMLADVTGARVEVPDGAEFGARGAALLAMAAVGRYATIHDAVAAARPGLRRHDPAPETAGAYAAARQRYDVAAHAFVASIARGSR